MGGEQQNKIEKCSESRKRGETGAKDVTKVKKKDFQNRISSQMFYNVQVGHHLKKKKRPLLLERRPKGF